MLISQIIGELERERAMRVYVFPRLREAGKLTDTEAAQRLERLGGAMEVCQWMLDQGCHYTQELPFRELQPKALNTDSGSISSISSIKDGAQ